MYGFPSDGHSYVEEFSSSERSGPAVKDDPAPAVLLSPEREAVLLRRAFTLALITIGYNIVEGLVSVWFGAGDDALALLGFGVDSFVEVISGLGIAHMLLRMRQAPVSARDGFERRALRITGSAFYLLAAGLLAGAAVNLVRQHVPATTVPGIVIALVSIATMYALMRTKRSTGRALGSEAMCADADCTRTCLQLSVLLLAASALYAMTGWGAADAVGSVAIAVLSAREGREAFMTARSAALGCGCHDSCESSPPPQGPDCS
jgi:hypothetical protein